MIEVYRLSDINVFFIKNNFFSESKEKSTQEAIIVFLGIHVVLHEIMAQIINYFLIFIYY